MVSSSVSHRHQVVKVSSAHSEGIPAGVLVAKGSVEAARLDSLPVSKVSADETTGGDGLSVHLHHLPNTGPRDLPAHQAHCHLGSPRVSEGPSQDYALRRGGGEELRGGDARGALGLGHP